MERDPRELRLSRREKRDPAKVMQARCRGAGTAAGLVFWCYAALAVATAGYAFWLLSRPDGAFTLRPILEGTWLEGYYGFYIESVSVSLADFHLTAAAVRNPKAPYLLLVFSAAALRLLTAGMLWNLRAVFRRVRREGTPFTEAAGKAVFWAGVCLLAGAFALHTAPYLAGSALGLVNGVDNLLDGGDAARLLAGGAMVCLSSVFRYGAALQTAADETL